MRSLPEICWSLTVQWEYEYYIKYQAILFGRGITVTERERCQRLGK
jgi:hypothetical protein